MSGFGTTVTEIKNEEKEAKVKAKVQAKATAAVSNDDPFAHLRAEQTMMEKAKAQRYDFIGVAGFDGTCKSGIMLDWFAKDTTKDPNAKLHVLDFDMGVAMLASALHTEEDNIVSWNPWAMAANDRTAYNYPATHQRVMDIMKYVHDQAMKGNPVWGVIISGVDSWLEICGNNMRIVDLGLSNDAIDAADGSGSAKIEKQNTWAIRNTRFHQLTALSRDLVRLGVKVIWETHMTTKDFYGPNKRFVPDWEKRTNNYLPTILLTEKEEELNEDGELLAMHYYVKFSKAKMNPELQDKRRKVFTTRPDGEPEWFGLPELYDGSL